MLPNVPLRLMSPDRHEILHLAAICVPARRIMNRNAELAIENGDEPVTELDGNSPVDANPAEFVEMGKIDRNALYGVSGHAIPAKQTPSSSTIPSSPFWP